MDVEQVADELGIRKPVTPDQVYACAIAGQLAEIRRLLEQYVGTQGEEGPVDDQPEQQETEVREPDVPAPDDGHRCEDCGRTFANAGALGSHARSHVDDEDG